VGVEILSLLTEVTEAQKQQDELDDDEGKPVG
jgi:hypothetical protein